MKVFKRGLELLNLTETFKKLPFLEYFNDYYLQKIIHSSQMIRYDTGETILVEGTQGNELYILFNGKVRIEKKPPTYRHLDKDWRHFWRNGDARP